MSSSQLSLPYTIGDTSRIQPSTRPFSPLPMQYLGSKARLASQLIERIRESFPQCKTFVDLFAGTGVVSLAAASFGYRIVANDLQPYSYAVVKSLLLTDRDGLDELAKRLAERSTDDYLLAGERRVFKKILEEER